MRCGKSFSESQPLDGIRIDQDKAAQVVSLFAEGVGVRAASRLTGLDQGTVLRILESAGEHCLRLLDAKVQNIKSERIEVDEIWSFVYCKNVNAQPFTDQGDQYVFLSSDVESKLIINHVVGKRTRENAYWFLRDLQNRVPERFQLTTDSFNGYTGIGRNRGTVYQVFGDGIDYGTEVKMYGPNPEGPRRYSPPLVIGTKRKARIGSPDPNFITTSHAERANLSVRLFNRRFTRLTIGYSKKLVNHKHAIAIFVAHFNFCRKHSAHGQTPAHAAGLTDRQWTTLDLLSATI